MSIRDKVIIVTGATAGIGRATAVALAKRGAHVVVTGRRADRLDKLVAGLAHMPGQRLALTGDLADESFARSLVEQTVAHFGCVDVLVNNAGLGHRDAMSTTPLADVRAIFDVNVLGLLATTQTAVSQMKTQGQGHIINISSIISQRPLPDAGAYTASKTAVNFISRSLRMELSPHNILVTVVYPGLTATEFAQARLGQPGGNRFGLRGIPPERVADAIVRAIEDGRLEVYITWTDWLFTHLNRLFPRLIDTFLTRYQRYV